MKTSFSRKTFMFFNILFMIFVALICLYPMYYVVVASFSDPAKVIAHKGILLAPIEPTLISYERAFKHPLIINSYMVTLFVLVVGVAINILLTAFAAYGISRKKLYLRKPISFLIMFTMYFSGGLIPTYLTVKDLGLLDNIWVMILPSALNTFNMIVLRTAFLSVPESLEESAFIDGASHFALLFKILMPLCLPNLAVITLYYGVSHWNAWFAASIYINDVSLYPLQLVMRQVLLANDTSSVMVGVDAGSQAAVSETIKYSLIVISTVPILLLYPILQKYFVNGIMVGAVKG